MELEASGLQIGYGEHVIVNQMDVSIARDNYRTKWLWKIDTVKGTHETDSLSEGKCFAGWLRYSDNEAKSIS